MNKLKKNKGFTLVELLVVIAIIGILAVVAMPSLIRNINKAKAADLVSYINALETVAIAEYAEKGEVGIMSGIGSPKIEDLVDDIPSEIDYTMISSDNSEKNKDRINIYVATYYNEEVGQMVVNQLNPLKRDKISIMIDGGEGDEYWSFGEEF